MRRAFTTMILCAVPFLASADENTKPSALDQIRLAISSAEKQKKTLGDCSKTQDDTLQALCNFAIFPQEILVVYPIDINHRFHSRAETDDIDHTARKLAELSGHPTFSAVDQTRRIVLLFQDYRPSSSELGGAFGGFANHAPLMRIRPRHENVSRVAGILAELPRELSKKVMHGIPVYYWDFSPEVEDWLDQVASQSRMDIETYPTAKLYISYTPKEPLYSGKPLRNLYRLTTVVSERVRGVDGGRVGSLHSPVARWVKLDIDGIRGGPVIPGSYDIRRPDPTLFAQIKRNVANSDAAKQLLSSNHQQTLIVAELEMVNSYTGEQLNLRRFTRELSLELQGLGSALSGDQLHVALLIPKDSNTLSAKGRAKTWGREKAFNTAPIKQPGAACGKLYDIAIAGQHAIAVGTKGRILRAPLASLKNYDRKAACADKVWTVITDVTGGNNVVAYHSINFVDDNVGYVSGDAGYILKTSDGGKSWGIVHQNPDPTPMRDYDQVNLHYVKALKNGQVFAKGYGSRGLINQGEKWIASPDDDETIGLMLSELDEQFVTAKRTLNIGNGTKWARHTIATKALVSQACTDVHSMGFDEEAFGCERCRPYETLDRTSRQCRRTCPVGQKKDRDNTCEPADCLIGSWNDEIQRCEATCEAGTMYNEYDQTCVSTTCEKGYVFSSIEIECMKIQDCGDDETFVVEVESCLTEDEIKERDAEEAAEKAERAKKDNPEIHVRLDHIFGIIKTGNEHVVFGAHGFVVATKNLAATKDASFAKAAKHWREIESGNNYWFAATVYKGGVLLGGKDGALHFYKAGASATQPVKSPANSSISAMQTLSDGNVVITGLDGIHVIAPTID